MSDAKFPPPPRARGRGWWRRFGRLALVLAAGAAAGSGAAWPAVEQVRELLAVRRLMGSGRQTTATVVDKRKTPGLFPEYRVVLRRDDRPGPTFERRVSVSDWADVGKGVKTFLYLDPSNEENCVAHLELGRRRNYAALALWTAVSLLSIAVAAWRAAALRRQLDLFRRGVEITARGTALEVHLKLGERLRIVSPAPTGKTLIRKTAGLAVELVALVSPDLKRFLFVDQGDVDE